MTEKKKKKKKKKKNPLKEFTMIEIKLYPFNGGLSGADKPDNRVGVGAGESVIEALFGWVSRGGRS